MWIQATQFAVGDFRNSISQVLNSSNANQLRAILASTKNHNAAQCHSAFARVMGGKAVLIVVFKSSHLPCTASPLLPTDL